MDKILSSRHYLYFQVSR